jgi:hypothetical protein
VLLAGLTKPGEVGEILALYRLKSLSLDYKAKLKSPCFFLQVTFNGQFGKGNVCLYILRFGI